MLVCKLMARVAWLPCLAAVAVAAGCDARPVGHVAEAPEVKQKRDTAIQAAVKSGAYPQQPAKNTSKTGEGRRPPL